MTDTTVTARYDSHGADEEVKGKEQKGSRKREVPERGRERKRHVREEQNLGCELEVSQTYRNQFYSG